MHSVNYHTHIQYITYIYKCFINNMPSTLHFYILCKLYTYLAGSMGTREPPAVNDGGLMSFIKFNWDGC